MHVRAPITLPFARFPPQVFAPTDAAFLNLLVRARHRACLSELASRAPAFPARYTRIHTYLDSSASDAFALVPPDPPQATLNTTAASLAANSTLVDLLLGYHVLGARRTCWSCCAA